MAKKKKARDIEKTYTTKQTIQKLRRLADCLEEGKAFRIQIVNERVTFRQALSSISSMSAKARMKKLNSSLNG